VSREEPAGEALAGRLGLAPGAPVFHTLIVHHENGVPLQCEDRYVNPACAPAYLDVDFTRTTPTHYLLEVAPLWEAQYAIEASAPTPEEARLLGIRRNEACLVVVRRTESKGVPITLARLVHPGSRYQIDGAFRP
jgi:GntR family histidine utilization transcriptional repressor